MVLLRIEDLTKFYIQKKKKKFEKWGFNQKCFPKKILDKDYSRKAIT